MRLQKNILLILSCTLPLFMVGCRNQPFSDLTVLQSEFKNPPATSRPFTWWHWMSGYITREGITKDLEWMEQFGLGGAIVFNVGMLSDNIPRPVPFQTDEWWEMADHAIREADRLGLKLGFHNCDGWSHSGGPWMEPDESMKKMVWTETFVTQGETDIVLPQPEILREYYQEVAVLAIPVEVTTASVPVKRLSSSLSSFHPDELLDGKEETFLALEGITESDQVCFDFEFKEPTPIAAITLGSTGGRMVGFNLVLEISNDGSNYQTLKEFQSQSKGHLGWKTQQSGSSISFNFPRSTAQYFRLRFKKCDSFNLTGISLFETGRIDLWEVKAAQIQYTEHGGAAEYYHPDRETYQQDYPKGIISAQSILDLADKLGEDGHLDWTPPEGNWRVIRIGQTTNGKTNGPSTPEGRGLEADKLNPAALTKHYNNFMKKLVDREVNEQTNSLAYTEIDSWEAGVQNWTSGFPEIFRKMNGYDMLPFLPVLTGGYIVESYEVSERFLWDYRKTIATLIRNGCFQQLANLAAGDGLTAFAEGSGRQQYLYDPINYMSRAPIPKGEFWAGPDGGANIPAGSPSSVMRPRVDCKVASSVAHIYGRELAASESFTGGTITWEMGPYDNKMLGDKAFAMGVNWIVLHTSTHQPYSHLKPGFSLGAAGSHFHRNNIVYEKNNQWPLYMARCQHLLRQGRFVADVLYFTGEDVPNYLGFRNELSVPLPEGYDYDGCNAEILLEQTQVKDGKIVLASGMEYRVLLLPDLSSLSLELINRIKELVDQGATVIGPPPQFAHGLRNFPEQDQLVATVAGEVWGDCDGKVVKENRYGKGKVIWGQSFEEIFEGMKLIPDFTYEGGENDAEINYIHRKSGDLDIYFIANARKREELIHASFRVSGKTPVLFDPGSGTVLQTATYKPGGESVGVSLQLEPTGSVFVVFSPGKARPSVIDLKGPEPARIAYNSNGNLNAEFFKSGSYTLTYSSKKQQEVEISLPSDLPLEGSWEVQFPSGMKGEENPIVTELFSWHESDNPKVKYFSGTAHYSKQFELPASYFKEGLKLYLNLGNVQKVASLQVNGVSCTDLWKAPFRVEITERVKPGINALELEVTNTWTNGLIGDEQLPADLEYDRYLMKIPVWIDGSTERHSERKTFTIYDFYQGNDELIESGLMGPVVIETSLQKEL